MARILNDFSRTLSIKSRSFRHVSPIIYGTSICIIMMIVYWSRHLVCRCICICTLILTLIEILLQPRRYNTFHRFCHSANYSLLERKSTCLITETQSTAYAGIQLSTDLEDRYYIANTQKTMTRLILSIGSLYFWYT